MSITDNDIFAQRLHEMVGVDPRSLFGYDAIEERGRRKQIDPTTRTEDRELYPEQRRRLISGARDLYRNFAIGAWAIRKHLDYVSSWRFRASSGNPEVDDELASLMNWWAKPANCDVANRHSLPRMIRLIESCRTIDGDVFVNQLADGRLQAIEGDRVKTPTGGLPGSIDITKMIHGVLTDDYGRAMAYAVCNRPRQSNELIFGSLLSSAFTRQLAYFNRFDQSRGVSPISSGLNAFRDVYEGMDYALAKAKISQMFGVAFKRGDDSGAMGTVSTEDDDDSDEPRYKVDFGRGPVQFDLDPGDDVSIIESKTPSTELQQFLQDMIGVAIKSLDLPLSFFDEGRANFSSGRQAWLLYDQSAKSKREDLRELLDTLTLWRIRLWLSSGDWVLPKGFALRDIKWQWISTGIPWIDPVKEATANVLEINSGTNSRQRICTERGEDFFEIADELAEEKAYAEEKGIEFTETPVTVNVSAGGDQQSNNANN